jgi:hypothetical protein
MVKTPARASKPRDLSRQGKEALPPVAGLRAGFFMPGDFVAAFFSSPSMTIAMT